MLAAVHVPGLVEACGRERGAKDLCHKGVSAQAAFLAGAAYLAGAGNVPNPRRHRLAFEAVDRLQVEVVGPKMRPHPQRELGDGRGGDEYVVAL